MSTLIKTDDIRIAYKVVIWLLLSNNIAGISLNPILFIYTLLFIIGIPGVILSIHYLISSLRKQPIMYFLPHVGAVIFNVFIILAIEEIGIVKNIVGGIIWPYINIGLSAIALFLIALTFFFKPTQNS